MTVRPTGIPKDPKYPQDLDLTATVLSQPHNRVIPLVMLKYAQQESTTPIFTTEEFHQKIQQLIPNTPTTKDIIGRVFNENAYGFPIKHTNSTTKKKYYKFSSWAEVRDRCRYAINSYFWEINKAPVPQDIWQLELYIRKTNYSNLHELFNPTGSPRKIYIPRRPPTFQKFSLDD
jgi:hypothetical protein